MNGTQSRKPVPARGRSGDSNTSGYGSYPTRSQDPTQGSWQSGSRAQLPSPNGRVIFEGYRKDILNNFEGEKPRFNPVCSHGYELRTMAMERTDIIIDERNKTTKLYAAERQ
jgi:hypothetical protein